MVNLFGLQTSEILKWKRYLVIYQLLVLNIPMGIILYIIFFMVVSSQESKMKLKFL